MAVAIQQGGHEALRRGDYCEDRTNGRSFFTISHFEGFSAVLIELPSVTKKGLRDAIIDAWLACAPQKLADEYLAQQRRSGI